MMDSSYYSHHSLMYDGFFSSHSNTTEMTYQVLDLNCHQKGMQWMQMKWATKLKHKMSNSNVCEALPSLEVWTI